MMLEKSLYFCVCSPQRQHLLVHTARTEGYSKLMLGDNCTRLAVKLLTSISLGRGAQLAQDTVRMCADDRQRGIYWDVAFSLQ